jgi:small-conductance mechanosensitive channel
MNEQEKANLNSLKNKKDVQKALLETKRKKSLKVSASTRDKLSIGTYVLILFGLAILKYILKIGTFLNLDYVNDFLPQKLQLSVSLIEGAMTVILLLTVNKTIKVLFINGIEDPATKFNLQRILNLLIGIILFFIVVSILFANWYTAVVSLGLISLILGFALQQPITSFIAWIHIIITRPYKVGDRIKIADSSGDVIDIGYLETTLWESVGTFLSTDFPSGRIIRFPNSSVLNTPIYNYSWPLFPYIWDEVKFYVGVNSDLGFVTDRLKIIAEEEIGIDMEEKITLYKEILQETAVDVNKIDAKPIVSLRVHENVLVEVSVRYLVEPKEAGNLKNNMVAKILSEFKANSSKVTLPQGL